jgi:hypothetical protein
MINSKAQVRVFSKLIVRVFKFKDLKRAHSEFHGSPDKSRFFGQLGEFFRVQDPGLIPASWRELNRT